MLRASLVPAVRTMNRNANCLAKLDRMKKALRHEEPDRVPISDFFWGSFLERWRRELGLPADADIYRYCDLDWIVTVKSLHREACSKIRQVSPGSR